MVKINPARRLYERLGFQRTHEDRHKVYCGSSQAADQRAGNQANGRFPREAPVADNRLAARRADQIASLKPFATRNATFFDALLALIRISSPVAGLRPLRAGRAGRIRT